MNPPPEPVKTFSDALEDLNQSSVALNKRGLLCWEMIGALSMVKNQKYITVPLRAYVDDWRKRLELDPVCWESRALSHWFEVEEGDRQLQVLGLAVLGIQNPGMHEACKTAAINLSAELMYDQLRELRQNQVQPGIVLEDQGTVRRP